MKRELLAHLIILGLSLTILLVTVFMRQPIHKIEDQDFAKMLSTQRLSESERADRLAIESERMAQINTEPVILETSY